MITTLEASGGKACRLRAQENTAREARKSCRFLGSPLGGSHSKSLGWGPRTCALQGFCETGFSLMFGGAFEEKHRKLLQGQYVFVPVVWKQGGRCIKSLSCMGNSDPSYRFSGRLFRESIIKRIIPVIQEKVYSQESVLQRM